MVNGEKETYWINQREFQYKDKEFGSDASLEVASVCTTQDFKYFSQVSISISIITDSDRRRRTINFNLLELSNLVVSLEQVESNYGNIYPNNPVKNDYKHENKILELLYKHSPKKNISAVRVRIVHSETDYGICVMSVNDFTVLLRLLSSFLRNYQLYRQELKQQAYNIKLVELTEAIERGIKVLPSHISSPKEVSTSVEKDVEIIGDQDLLKDFDVHMDTSISTKLPEEVKLEQEITKEVQVIKSHLVNDVADGDLINFEKLLVAASSEYKAIESVLNRLKSNIEVEETFQFLPGISEKDYKSALYISRFFYLLAVKQHISSGAKIPEVTPAVIKFKPVKVDYLNREIAYDLFLFGAYIKCASRKLSTKESDSQMSKQVSYYATRCFTDIFCFSFLDGIDKDTITNLTLSRFRSYQRANFFGEYEAFLKSYNCTQVEESNIREYIDLIYSDTIGSTVYVDELHNKLYTEGPLLLPSTNNLDIEQITNYAVRINVLHAVKEFNIRKIDLPTLNQVLDTQVPPHLFDLMRGEKKRIVERKDYRSTLHKYLLHYQADLPSGMKESLLTYIEGIGIEDFEYTTVVLEDLDEKFIRAIYYHNNLSKDKRSTVSLADFSTYVERECVLVKSEIIDKIRGKKEEKVEEVKTGVDELTKAFDTMEF